MICRAASRYRAGHHPRGATTLCKEFMRAELASRLAGIY